MKVEIHFRDMSSTEALKSHIEGSVTKLQKFQKNDELIRVIVGARGHRHYAEIYWHDKTAGKDFFAKEEGQDLYVQVDQVVETILHQLKKEHEKMIDKHHKREPLKRAVSG